MPMPMPKGNIFLHTTRAAIYPLLRRISNVNLNREPRTQMNTYRIVALAFAFTATTASAQDFYVGGGLSYTDGESLPQFGGSSDLGTGMLSLIIGTRHDFAASFVGLEASADLGFGAETTNHTGGQTCAVGAIGPYLCSHDATYRLVGLFGVPFSTGTEVFGSLGIGVLHGQFADSPNTTGKGAIYGATFGLGVNHTLGGANLLRGELIYDNFGKAKQSGGYTSKYDDMSIRISMIHKF